MKPPEFYKGIEFKIDYESYKNVSPDREADKLVFIIKQPWLFDPNLKNLTEEQKRSMEVIVIKKSIPAQMPEDEYKTYEVSMLNAGGTLRVVQILTIIRTLFVSGNAVAFWSCMRALTLQSYTSLSTVRYPSHV